jgi:hypothetical protein
MPGLPSRLPAALALTCALACALPAAFAQAQPVSPAGLRTTKLTAGLHVITAEVADNDMTRMRGLMFRRSLEPNHGMFFVFEGKGRQCMWMRNTYVALSVAFVDDDGSIVNIEDMQPQTEDSHCSRRPVRYALEMEKGWFARRGIKDGMKLGGVPAAQK